MADREELGHPSTSRYSRRSPLARRLRGGARSAGHRRTSSAWEFLSGLMGRSSRGHGRHMRHRLAGARWRSGIRRRGGRWGGRLASAHSISVKSDLGYSTAEHNNEARRRANAARSGIFARHLATARRNPTTPRFPPPRRQVLDVENTTRAMPSEQLAAYSTSLPPAIGPKTLATTMQQPPPNQPLPLQTPSQQQQSLSAPQQQQWVPSQQPPPAPQQLPLEPQQSQPPAAPSQPPQEALPVAPQRPPLLTPSAPPQRPPQLLQSQPLLHPFFEAPQVQPRPLVAAKFSKGACAHALGETTVVLDGDPAANDAHRVGTQASWSDDTVVEDFVAANYDSGGGTESSFSGDGRRGAKRDSHFWRRGKRRRGTPLRKRRARGRKMRRRYRNEESDSESDSESSSDDSDDNQLSPTWSRDCSRRKRRREHRKVCRCYRRSICECDEGLSRMSRALEAFTRKDVPHRCETWEQTMTASFPDLYEEVTEDYLAPGHPDYNAAFGGPVVRRTRTIRPYSNLYPFPSCGQSSKIGNLATTPQWESGHQEQQRSAPIYQQVPSASRYANEDQAFIYALPPCDTVPAEFFCEICGYFGCHGDCWTWVYQPRSESEEWLRLDECQRLDFEERVPMQERIDRLEERMWLYNRGAPRRSRPTEDERAVDLFEGDKWLYGGGYSSDSECTVSDEVASDESCPCFETGEPQRQRSQSSSSQRKRLPRERSVTDSQIQCQCSLTDETHRRSSTSSVSGASSKSLKKRSSGRRIASAASLL
ncbi:hypothetical protein MRX96_046407 [Rhipicephalus microplus]